jgi:hypothetical protein
VVKHGGASGRVEGEEPCVEAEALTGSESRLARKRRGGAVATREVGKTRHRGKRGLGFRRTGLVGFQMTGRIYPGPKLMRGFGPG